MGGLWLLSNGHIVSDVVCSDSDHTGDRKINSTRSVTGIRYYATELHRPECPFTGKVESSLYLKISSASADIYAISETVRDSG